uniref:Adaptor related protein complex 3 subunit sigma 2 n=1 Tax=Bubo bubo TaxID=30461 RepID=A0A8C0FEB5_BUBBB
GGTWVLQAVHPWVLALASLQAEEVQQQIIRETFHLVLKRDDHICNFLECGSLFGGSDYKLIYRHYATLYFVFCVDSSESELGILDLIQVFVETLDKCFENVCELDLIFHMDKVHHILQEVVIGGMVLETNMNEIVAQVEAQSKLEKAEVSGNAAALPRGRLMRFSSTYGVSPVPPVSTCLSCGEWAGGIPPLLCSGLLNAGSSPSVEMAVPLKVNNLR